MSSQVDENGTVYNPKTVGKRSQNDHFTVTYGVNTDPFRSVFIRITGRSNTHRILSVS